MDEITNVSSFVKKLLREYESDLKSGGVFSCKYEEDKKELVRKLNFYSYLLKPQLKLIMYDQLLMSVRSVGNPVELINTDGLIAVIHEFYDFSQQLYPKLTTSNSAITSHDYGRYKLLPDKKGAMKVLDIIEGFQFGCEVETIKLRFSTGVYTFLASSDLLFKASDLRTPIEILYKKDRHDNADRKYDVELDRIRKGVIKDEFYYRLPFKINTTCLSSMNMYITLYDKNNNEIETEISYIGGKIYRYLRTQFLAEKQEYSYDGKKFSVHQEKKKIEITQIN
jgi:hypothetical protein